MVQQGDNREWTRYYRVGDASGASALHARFVKHRYPRHSHEYYVVGLVETGVQSYRYRGERHFTRSGDLFFVNPGEPHTGEPGIETGYVYRTLYVTPDFLAKALGEFRQISGNIFLRGAVLHDPTAAALFGRLHDRIALHAPALEQGSLLLDALGLLFSRHSDARCVMPDTGKENTAILRAREYLEANFDRDISLSVLAGAVSLSPFYFARIFEKGTGLPPHRYLESIRIRRACALLERGEAIAAEATSVGYADQSHLTKRFKRYLGITPRQFRDEQIRA